MKKAATPMTKKTKKHVKKTIVSVSSQLGLVLEGTVYLVEYNKQGKIISKVALDNESVLKALAYVVSQSTKTKSP